MTDDGLTEDERAALWRQRQRAARANRRRVGSALSGDGAERTALAADWDRLVRALREWRSPDAD